MYYAANNHYGSPTDVGFANTWYVLAFETKAERDAYVENSTSRAARAIYRHEVTSYATNWHMTRNEYIKPRPFSGEYWGIDETGLIHVCGPYENCPRLNK